MAGKRIAEAFRVAMRRLQDTGASDANLLARYVTDRNEAAFAELVRRHSAMVKGVARRILSNEQDAEDVSQAVFLLFARKAARLERASVAGWLCAAARLTALNARKIRTRRTHKEASARRARPVCPTPLDQMTAAELVSALDEELARLPDRYRGPLVLCYLEGLSRDEAARRQGVPTSTLNVQLDRGRNQLHAFLAKRGIALGVALLAVVAAPVSGAAQQRIVRLVLGAIARGKVPPAVAGLIQGSTIMTKINCVLGAVFLAGALGVAGAVGFGVKASTPVPNSWSEPPAHERQTQAQNPAPQASEPPLARAEDKPKNAPPTPDAKPLEVRGRVLGPDGKPKAGAQLFLVGENEKPADLGVSGADGVFSVTVPGTPARTYASRYLVAHADGAGLDFVSLVRWKAAEPVELCLVKENVIRGRVVSTEGKPIGGVRVFPEEISVHIDNKLDTFLAGHLRSLAGGRGTTGQKTLRPGREAPFGDTTDADGRFAIRGLGTERTIRLRFFGGGIADTTKWVANRAGFEPERYNEAFRDRFVTANQRRDQPWMAYWMLFGPEVKFVAGNEKVIRGTVKDAVSGKGQPGLGVQLVGDLGRDQLPYGLEARTDGEGRYEIRGASKARSYMVQVQVASGAAMGYFLSQVVADDTAGYQPVVADLKLKKGVIITGKVIDRATGQPIRGMATAAALQGNPFAKDYPEAPPTAGSDGVDADGTFHLVTIPGPVLLMGRPDYNLVDPLEVLKFASPVPDPTYPQYFQGPAYVGLGKQPEMIEGNFCKVLDIKVGVPLVKQDIVLEPGRAIEVKLQDAQGRGLAGVWAASVSLDLRGLYGALRIEKDTCPVYGLEPGKSRLMVFCEPGRKLAGTLKVNGDDKSPLVVKLGAAGALKGRLLDEAGKPLAGIEIKVGYQEQEAKDTERAVHEQKPPVTDADGVFTVENVIPGLKLELTFQKDGRKLECETKPTRMVVELKPGECLDVGASKLKFVPFKSSFSGKEGS